MLQLNLPVAPLFVRRIVSVLVVAIALTPPADAADPPPGLLASSRAQVDLLDYEAATAKLPPDARAQFAADPNLVLQMLNNLYLNASIAVDARADGLERDPLVARQIAQQTDRLLAQLYVERLDRKTADEFDRDQGKYLARAREIYLTEPDQFRAPERVDVSRIIVRVRRNDDAAADANAKVRADALRAELVSGADFAQLARAKSDDPSAKDTGGRLGWVSATTGDPIIFAAGMALKKPGEISPVTKTDLGYEIILLHERKPEGMRSFEEVRVTLLGDIKQKLIEDRRKSYQTGAFANPAPALNEVLLDKLTKEARAVAKPITGNSPPAR